VRRQASLYDIESNAGLTAGSQGLRLVSDYSITARCLRHQVQGKFLPRKVQMAIDERFRRVEQMEQRVQMLVGIFASHRVLPLEFKPAYSVRDLLLQHLDELEQVAERKGGVLQALSDHFAKVYKVSLRLVA
jgi:hypothetical protein